MATVLVLLCALVVNVYCHSQKVVPLEPPLIDTDARPDPAVGNDAEMAKIMNVMANEPKLNEVGDPNDFNFDGLDPLDCSKDTSDDGCGGGPQKGSGDSNSGSKGGDGDGAAGGDKSEGDGSGGGGDGDAEGGGGGGGEGAGGSGGLHKKLKTQVKHLAKMLNNAKNIQKKIPMQEEKLAALKKKLGIEEKDEKIKGEEKGIDGAKAELKAVNEKLEKLQKRKAELEAQIKKLEGEVATDKKEDPAAAAAAGKGEAAPAGKGNAAPEGGNAVPDAPKPAGLIHQTAAIRLAGGRSQFKSSKRDLLRTLQKQKSELEESIAALSGHHHAATAAAKKHAIAAAAKKQKKQKIQNMKAAKELEVLRAGVTAAVKAAVEERVKNDKQTKAVDIGRDLNGNVKLFQRKSSSRQELMTPRTIKNAQKKKDFVEAARQELAAAKAELAK